MTNGVSATALERLLRPLSRNLSEDLARALIAMQADPETQNRYDELSERHSEGQLTEDERIELESIVRANTLVGVLKAEARLVLAVPRAA